MPQVQVLPRERLLRPAAHDRLAALLTPEDRAWLARMADVLPPGWVVYGMSVPPRGGVVTDSSYPGGVRLVIAPAGPAGQARVR